MNKAVVAIMVTLSLTSCGTVKHASAGHVVLPNSKLIGCKASRCSQLWQDAHTGAAAVYPHNVSIDIDHDAILGIVAHYDKSASYDDIKAAIDDRYGKWMYVDSPAPVKVWRVEPEKIAIQLAAEDNGMNQVIYLSASAWRQRHDVPAAVPGDDSH